MDFFKKQKEDFTKNKITFFRKKGELPKKKEFF